MLRHDRANDDAEEQEECTVLVGSCSSMILHFFLLFLPSFANNELMKLVSLIPGEMGCFKFLRFEYKFNAFALFFIFLSWPSCSRYFDSMLRVLIGLGLGGAKQVTRGFCLGWEKAEYSASEGEDELDVVVVVVLLKNNASCMSNSSSKVVDDDDLELDLTSPGVMTTLSLTFFSIHFSTKHALLRLDIFSSSSSVDVVVVVEPLLLVVTVVVLKKSSSRCVFDEAVRRSDTTICEVFGWWVLWDLLNLFKKEDENVGFLESYS